MSIYTRPGILLIPSLFVFACSGSGTSSDPGREGGRRTAGGGATVPVVTARVEQKSMPVTLPAVGTVEAVSSVEVRSQVTGQLSAIHFAEGREVRRGQPLFTLDPRPFEAALKQAEAVLARDTATLQNAQAQQQRIENLFQRGLIPRDQYESQQASAAALAATVAADKAAVETAQLNRQYTTISAPISGRTGAFGVHAGDLIRANDAQPLVVINQLSPTYVSFSVPGRYLPEIRQYQAKKPLSVTATIPAAAPAASVATGGARPQGGPQVLGNPDGSAETGGGAPAERGRVSFIDNAVDAATGTIRLKGTFENAGRQLWPGAFVRVVLDLTTDPEALVVPATAVQASQEGQYVYVVKADRTVEMRPVTLERQQGDEAVIASGVRAGEVVVTDGQLRLTPGARVTDRSERPEGAAPGMPRGAEQGRGKERP